jgi:hypothetical protein
MVTNEFLEQACSEVSEYSDDQMMSEFDRFFQDQPAICDFVVEATNESDPKIQELSLFLAYMVFKAVKYAGPDDAKVVTPHMIESAYHDSEHWIDQLSQADEPHMEEISTKLQEEAEPHLIRYIISELNQPLEDGAELEDEQKGEVFFVLKTVISSLARRTE